MTELAYQQRARQEAIEYGTFRAKYPILHDGVIAYQPGNAVPISNVKRYGYDTDGLVERVDGLPVDAPLPEGHAPIVEQQPAGEGWVDGPSEQPEPLPQGEPIELGGQPADDIAGLHGAAEAAQQGNADLAQATDAVTAAVTDQPVEQAVEQAATNGAPPEPQA